MMPTAAGKEGTSSAVLIPAQFSLLDSTPSLAPLQADKICPSWGRIGTAWRIEDGRGGRGLSQDLVQIIPWLGAFVSPLRNYAHASRVRKVPQLLEVS